MKRISDADFLRLLDDIVLTKNLSGRVVREDAAAGDRNCKAIVFDPISGQKKKMVDDIRETVTREDVDVQLRAMIKIRDNDKLMRAIHDCDTWTLRAIQQASIDIQSDLLEESGQFVDADGEILRMPVDIWFSSGESVSPYLPLGIVGLRQAIANALRKIATQRDAPGPPKKPYQIELAVRCVVLFEHYGSPGQQKPWCDTDAKKQSKIVGFASEIFSMAGMSLACNRIVTLLNNARRLHAKK